VTTTPEPFQAKHGFLVTAPSAWQRRPFLVASNFITNELLERFTAALVTGDELNRKTSRHQPSAPRKPKRRRDPPGWIFLPRQDSGLNLDSYLTPALFTRSYSPSRSVGPVSGAKFAQFCKIVRLILSELPAQTSPVIDGLHEKLPPPAHRAGSNPSRQTLFKILATSGWKAPSFGDIITTPSWHPSFPSACFVVVSSTAWNTRYLYPEIIVVPSVPVDDTSYSIDDWFGIGRVVLGTNDGVTKPRVVAEEEVRRLNFAQDYWNECPRCFNSTRPWCFLVDGGTEKGKCIHCDSAKPPLAGKAAKVVDDPEVAEREAKDLAFYTALMGLPYLEMTAFTSFFGDHTPFATKHGVKGAEFDTVYVVLDDKGARWTTYSFDKYLSGEDETANRKRFQKTRNVFYVCCSRAKKRLAVIDLGAASAKKTAGVRAVFGATKCFEM